MKNVMLFSGVAAATLFAGSASASLVSDTFTYPDGNLVGNGGWVDQGGSTPLLVSGGQAVVEHGGGSRQDAEIVFADDVTTGSFTATFDVTVTDDTEISGGDYEYFAHFSDDGNFNFRGRLFVAPSNLIGGDYTLGIATSASSPEASLPIDLTYGTTYSVDLTFDLDSGLATVAIGGDSATSTTVDDDEIIDSFNLRASNSSNDETILIDNLVIVPEPATAFLVGLGGLAMLRRRSA
ncbi:MAG: PEP-CTERM sorting domain-containing protein [Planctomycetota bacterium]